MASLSSLLRLCLLVLLFALSTTSAAAQYNITSMTGGAGCVLGSTPPLSCTFPATVSVSFTASSPPWSSNSTCYITFLGQGGQFIIAYGNPSPADPTNHTVAFSLFAYAYQTALMSRPLSAYVVCDSSGAIASPAFHCRSDVQSRPATRAHVHVGLRAHLACHRSCGLFN